MRIVIDTNILISSLSSKSKFHWILQLLKSGTYDLLISNEILFEYEEKLKLKYGIPTTSVFFELLFNLENVYLINIHFRWNLIHLDESDNKFIDCYVSGNADYLLTEDHHFNILKNVDFPEVKTINIKDFEDFFNL